MDPSGRPYVMGSGLPRLPTFVSGRALAAQGELRPNFYNPYHVKHRRRTTKEQLTLLELTFKTTPKPSSETRKTLATRLGMTAREVQIWFQNRRAKQKNMMLRARPSDCTSPEPVTGDGAVPKTERAASADRPAPVAAVVRRHSDIPVSYAHNMGLGVTALATAPSGGASPGLMAPGMMSPGLVSNMSPGMVSNMAPGLMRGPEMAPGGIRGQDMVPELMRGQDMPSGLVRCQEMSSGLVRCQDMTSGAITGQDMVPGLVRCQDMAPGLIRGQDMSPGLVRGPDITPSFAGASSVGPIGSPSYAGPSGLPHAFSNMPMPPGFGAQLPHFPEASSSRSKKKQEGRGIARVHQEAFDGTNKLPVKPDDLSPPSDEQFMLDPANLPNFMMPPALGTLPLGNYMWQPYGSVPQTDIAALLSIMGTPAFTVPNEAGLASDAAFYQSLLAGLQAPKDNVFVPSTQFPQMPRTDAELFASAPANSSVL
ncbi:hypothetical protein IW142_003917 [Coemansia sp. RSA 564]|nr:hypothetical protein IW142_003917 [Coemansia sp. RSA 564]KAJ2190560.1 hypothetical protein IW144_005362 [Coemansia sp. RSA 522]